MRDLYRHHYNHLHDFHAPCITTLRLRLVTSRAMQHACASRSTLYNLPCSQHIRHTAAATYTRRGESEASIHPWMVPGLVCRLLDGTCASNPSIYLASEKSTTQLDNGYYNHLVVVEETVEEEGGLTAQGPFGAPRIRDDARLHNGEGVFTQPYRYTQKNIESPSPRRPVKHHDTTEGARQRVSRVDMHTRHWGRGWVA